MKIALLNFLDWLLSTGGHLLTLVVSVIAAFGIGSVLSAHITGEKARRNAIAAMRRDWINNIRSDLATFSGYAQKFDRMLARSRQEEKGSDRHNQLRDEVEELRSKKVRCPIKS